MASVSILAAWVAKAGLLATAASLAGVQTPGVPAADAPRFVAERANSVSWNPDGKFLGFSYRASSGHIDEIGMYDLDNRRGKVLMTPTAGQKVDQTVWLAGSPVEIVCTTESSQAAGKMLDRTSIWALDGTKLSAKALWSQEFPAEQHARMFVEPSPSLTHAIVTVKTDATTVYYVITLGADDVEISTDISQGIAEGCGFAGWTVDGTAFFGHGIQNDLVDELLSFDVMLDGAQGQRVLNLDANTISAGVLVSAPVRLEVSAATSDGTTVLTLKPARPSVAVGTIGYELIPTNGVLRQVRFRGFWDEPPKDPVKTALASQRESLRYGESTASAKSFWLKPNEPDAKSGQLVSPQAERAWLHPDGRTVAFTVNGVLFVRTFKEKMISCTRGLS